MASSMMSMKLTGDKELMRRLDVLPDRMRKRVIGPAVSQALTPVRRAMRAGAPRESDTLRLSITKKTKKYRSGVIYGAVGPKKSFSSTYKGRRRVPYHYVHLAEEGTKPHIITPESRRALLLPFKDAEGKPMFRGVVSHPGARPSRFMLAAWLSNRSRSMRIMHTRVRAGLAREASRK